MFPLPLSPSLRSVRWMIPLVVLAAGCGRGDPAFSDGATEPASGATAAAGPDTGSTSIPAAVPPDGLTPGSTTTLTATLSDGTELKYAIVIPLEFDPAEEYPVLLALPPGGQDVDLTAGITERVYQSEAVARGWVVVSPAAPNGTLFFQGSEALIPEFLYETLAWLRPEGGKYHLAGISNGGISAFRIAGAQPDRFASMVVFPGFARSEQDVAAFGSYDFGVSMFVGGEDTGWIGSMQSTLAALEDAGVAASLDILAGEGHVMQSLNDGVDVFDILDAAR